MKDGKLIVRDGLTRVPLGVGSFREWGAIDVAAEVEKQSKLFWAENPPENGVFGKWPDAGLYPSGLFVLDGELIQWAEGVGIATGAEVQELLTPFPQSNAAGNMPSASIKEWISKAQELGSVYVAAWKAAGYNPTKGDAALYVEGLFSTEGIYGDRDEVLDRATIERHALKGITGNPQGYKSNKPKIPNGMRHKLPQEQ